MMDDAEYAFVGMGTICGTARVVTDSLRKEGMKVGMIKIKAFRPGLHDQVMEELGLV